ncbi:CHAT domain-containing protein [uncultured Nostoc sp.]|uniref:CHAT domain-containing protein n=1 Tax=uncultured Nostoc sp. TaxID=340711 RepID=UPI0035CC5770
MTSTFDNTNDSKAEANQWYERGKQALQDYQYLDAIACFEKALAIVQQMENLGLESVILTKIGTIYNTIGQYQEAIQQHQKALTIADQLNDPELKSLALLELGNDYFLSSQYQKAVQSYQRAKEISHTLKNSLLEGQALGSLGIVYTKIRNYPEADTYYKEALKVFESIQVDVETIKGEEIRVANNQGDLNLFQNKYQEAIDCYGKVLEWSHQTGDQEGESIALSNLGNAYRGLEDNQQAIILYQQALEIFQKIGSPDGESSTWNNLGTAYRSLGDIPKAIDAYQQALQITQQTGNLDRQGNVLGNLGFLSEAQGDLSEAMQFYEQAIQIKESIQSHLTIEDFKIPFVSDQIDVYARFISLLWDQKNFEVSFNYTERARSRAFLDQLANGHINFHQGAETDLLNQERDLKAQIQALIRGLALNPPPKQKDELTPQLNSRRQDYENLLREIKLKSPALASLVSVDVATLSDIQKQLSENTTLLEYFVTVDRTFVFLITHNSFDTVAIDISYADLDNEVNKRKDEFGDLNNLHPDSFQQLMSQLIKPLQGFLKTPHLTIVPHSILNYVPFAALTDDTHYLSDTYTLSILPSASVLRFLKPLRGENPYGTILALGDPDTEGLLPKLPGAREEAKEITQLFNTQPLIGKKATETVVRSQAGSVNILHLAAHGEFNQANPLFSTIHLAADDQNDGRLEVHEIYELDLTSTTNLVVLSACDANKGELSKGDDIVGLVRAFLDAGASAVVASLWQVNDASTKELMVKFYQHLQTGLALAAALQQAQQEVRQQSDYAHPYYWAAFVLTGQEGK